jgi:hypothetical protein
MNLPVDESVMRAILGIVTSGRTILRALSILWSYTCTLILPVMTEIFVFLSVVT